MDNHNSLEERFRRLNRVYAVLSSINKSIVRTHNKKELLKDVCQIAVKEGEYVLAWIGKLNTLTNKVEILASDGVVEYSNNLNIDLNYEEQSNGPSGIALKSGKHFFSMDIKNDRKMEPWRERALSYGLRSCISLPLIAFGEIRGILNLYS
ncbi:MAG: GAF domain-containing protein, partial [Bacteroidota bacterium]|nr:GAF domain-containing protein [Bacteroidota bacterium]